MEQMIPSQKCSSTAFIEVYTSQRMPQLQMGVHDDLDLYFQSHTISGNIFIGATIWKTGRASKECSSTTFIEVDIRYRMT